MGAGTTSEWPALYLLACNEHSVYKDPTGFTQEGAEPLEANKKPMLKTRITQKPLDVQLSVFPFLIRLESAGLAKRQPYSIYNTGT